MINGLINSLINGLIDDLINGLINMYNVVRLINF